MARVIISEVVDSVVEKEKLFGFIPLLVDVNYFYIVVDTPSGKQEKILMLRERMSIGDKTPNSYSVPVVTYEKNRLDKIKSIVAKYENEGYRVDTSQFSLFLKKKIETLIFENKKS